MERNILLTIEYDGSNYSGWQRQPEDLTVQGRLEKVLSKVCGHEVLINGTSRTDAGVHALGQRATFVCNSPIPTDKLLLATNNMLNGGMNKKSVNADIRIVNAEEVSMDFHARFNSKGKTYRYLMKHGGKADIFLRNQCYFINKKLDLKKMIVAKGYIEGTHDFKCFQASGGTIKETTVRTIYGIKLEEKGEFIEIRVTGDGFLYNMVRIIVGTLVDVGLGKIEPHQLKEIINNKDRSNAGHTAPAQGLYLEEIYY